MAVLWSVLLAALVIMGTTVVHYEGIRWMDRYARAHQGAPIRPCSR